MKIKRVYIAAFGGLKNKTVEFSDGFNVIYGENENGKTTVMSFIKMMFYGSERGSSSIAKNLRKKYAPWSGERAAGNIDFEHRGRNYRLEREFRSSNSTDKVTLINMSDGTRESLSGDVGSKFFGLSAAAFERSVFVGRFGKAESDASAESEINSKLSNTVTTGDESVSYNTVSDRLQKARLALISKSGRAGECDKNKKRLSELKGELEKAERVYEKHADYIENAERMRILLKNKGERAAFLKKKIESEQDMRNAAKLRELLDTKAELERTKEELRLSDGGVIDDMYVGKLKLCLAKYETAAERLKSKNEDMQRLSAGIETAEDKGGREKVESIEKEIKALNNKKTEIENDISANKKNFESLKATENDVKGKRRGINVPFAVVAGAMILAALLFFAFKLQISALIFLGAAVLSALLCFILRPTDKRAEAEYEDRLKAIETEIQRLSADKTDILQEISLLSVRLEAINTSLGMGTAALENQKKLLAENKNAAAKLKAEYEAAEKTLLGLYGNYKSAYGVEEIRGELNALTEKAEKLKQIKQQLTYLSRDLDNISYNEARKKLAALPETAEKTDFDAARAEYGKLNAEIAEKSAALAAAETEDRINVRNVSDPEALKAEIKELTEKISRQESFCRAADTALEILQSSFAELRGSYGSVLEKRSGEIFARLTGGTYGNVLISKAFDISVEKSREFGSHEAEYLSSGAADQAYLSLRLALSEIIFETSGELPVFLDDSLAQYDDRRMKIAVEFLKEYSENGQVIMFTCHGAIKNAAVQSGAYETDLVENNEQK